MTVDDLIRKLRRFARKRGHRFVVVAARGKGSHAVLELDDRAAPVPITRGTIWPLARCGASCRHPASPLTTWSE